MRVSRRRARAVVLALLAVSFAGPWGAAYPPHEPPRPDYFWELIDSALRSGPVSYQMFVAAIMAVPLACLLAVLLPLSRPIRITYRIFLGAVTVATWALWIVTPPASIDDFLDAGGMGLYMVGLLLALTVEISRARDVPRREYVEVFR